MSDLPAPAFLNFLGAGGRQGGFETDDVLAAADKDLDAGLMTQLDELTVEYRWGDDAR